MMRCKGNERVEDGSLPAKMIRKWTLVEVKEIQINVIVDPDGIDPKSNSGQSELV
jgi:hypothetical protein